MIEVADSLKNRAGMGTAEGNGRFHERVEHSLQIEGRTADHLQHVSSRGLLLKRFAEVVGALVQLLEQAGVLDGDDGLLGEVAYQIDLLVGEGTHFLPENRDGAN